MSADDEIAIIFAHLKANLPHWLYVKLVVSMGVTHAEARALIEEVEEEEWDADPSV